MILNLTKYPTLSYPSIGIPWRLRLRFLWNLCWRFATAINEEGASSYALERDFKGLIECENATIWGICFCDSRSVAEFDDLRQDALSNIWRGMESIRGEASRKTCI